LVSASITLALMQVKTQIAHVFSSNPEQFSLVLDTLILSIIPFAFCFIGASVLRGLNKIVFFAFFTFAGFYFGALIILVTLVAFGVGERSIALSFTVSSWICSLIVVCVIYRCAQTVGKVGVQRGSRSSKSILKNLYELSLPLYFSGFALIVLGGTDTLLLGYFSDEVNVAKYNISLKFAVLVALGVSAVNSVAAPKIAQYHSEENSKSLVEISKQSAAISFTISILIAIPMSVFGKNILGLYGASFESSLSILLVLMAGYSINAFSGSAGTILMMTDQQNRYKSIMLITALLNVFLSMLLIPMYDALGAALAMAISMAFWNIYSVIAVKRTKGFWCGFDVVYVVSKLRRLVAR